MDVVLLKDVERLGKQGAIVKVKPGYARNFLLPRGLANEATRAAVRSVEEVRRQQEGKRQRQRKELEAVKQKIESRRLTLTLAVGENDSVFGSVTAHEIVEALAGDKITVEKSMVQLSEPIKSLGIHEVPVRLQSDLIATLKVNVTKA